MTNPAASTAYDPAAPADERLAAQAELQKAYMPKSPSDLVPAGLIMELAQQMQVQYEDQLLMAKSAAGNVVPFPSRSAKSGEPGMQSVRVDDLQISVLGDYWERPGQLSFDSLREMVAQTPILTAVVDTRVRQVQRFCRVSEKGDDAMGFQIRHADAKHQLTPGEQEHVNKLQRFISNCGWEFKPRRRKALRRDAFSAFMAKAVRDSLSMDSVGIELEWKRDRSLGIDGFYSVDGATIRLCSEHGYQGDDEIFALQVVQGRVSTAYGFDDLIYEPRNPRTDVTACGYGRSETELLIRVVTGFLNAMTANIKGFDSNSIPKGMLHLTGNYTETDLISFKRQWNAAVRGVNNSWALPVMVSKDAESKAQFERFGVEFNEMYFSKWMTFLTSIVCAVFGMSPAEINFDSFTGGGSSALSGSDTAEKLAASKDSGFVPVMAHFENLFSENIVSEFGDEWVFRWTGLSPEDAERKQSNRMAVLTVDELRAEEGYEKHPDPLIGGAPLNASLVGLYTQKHQAELQPQQDFGADGQPGGGDQAANGADRPEPGQGDFGQHDGDQADFGQPQDDGHGGAAPVGKFGKPEPAQQQLDFGGAGGKGEDFGKSFPVVYEVAL